MRSLKYQLIRLFIFLYSTRLTAHQILSRLIKISVDISKEHTEWHIDICGIIFRDSRDSDFKVITGEGGEGDLQYLRTRARHFTIFTSTHYGIFEEQVGPFWNIPAK